eukprot:tig00001545_g9336.t1
MATLSGTAALTNGTHTDPATLAVPTAPAPSAAISGGASAPAASSQGTGAPASRGGGGPREPSEASVQQLTQQLYTKLEVLAKQRESLDRSPMPRETASPAGPQQGKEISSPAAVVVGSPRMANVTNTPPPLSVPSAGLSGSGVPATPAPVAPPVTPAPRQEEKSKKAAVRPATAPAAARPGTAAAKKEAVSKPPAPRPATAKPAPPKPAPPKPAPAKPAALAAAKPAAPAAGAKAASAPKPGALKPATAHAAAPKPAAAAPKPAEEKPAPEKPAPSKPAVAAKPAARPATAKPAAKPAPARPATAKPAAAKPAPAAASSAAAAPPARPATAPAAPPRKPAAAAANKLALVQVVPKASKPAAKPAGASAAQTAAQTRRQQIEAERAARLGKMTPFRKHSADPHGEGEEAAGRRGRVSRPVQLAAAVVSAAKKRPAPPVTLPHGRRAGAAAGATRAKVPALGIPKKRQRKDGGTGEEAQGEGEVADGPQKSGALPAKPARPSASHKAPESPVRDQIHSASELRSKARAAATPASPAKTPARAEKPPGASTPVSARKAATPRTPRAAPAEATPRKSSVPSSPAVPRGSAAKKAPTPRAARSPGEEPPGFDTATDAPGYQFFQGYKVKESPAGPVKVWTRHDKNQAEVDKTLLLEKEVTPRRSSPRVGGGAGSPQIAPRISQVVSSPSVPRYATHEAGAHESPARSAHATPAKAGPSGSPAEAERRPSADSAKRDELLSRVNALLSPPRPEQARAPTPAPASEA